MMTLSSRNTQRVVNKILFYNKFVIVFDGDLIALKDDIRVAYCGVAMLFGNRPIIAATTGIFVNLLSKDVMSHFKEITQIFRKIILCPKKLKTH